LGFHRRAVVDERTALSNRLQALLKQYFPQALTLCGPDLWRPLATAFLLKWPSLGAVQKAKAATLKETSAKMVFFVWRCDVGEKSGSGSASNRLLFSSFMGSFRDFLVMWLTRFARSESRPVV